MGELKELWIIISGWLLATSNTLGPILSFIILLVTFFITMVNAIKAWDWLVNRFSKKKKDAGSK